MGGAINGRPLDEAGGMVGNVRRFLDLAAAALVEAKAVADEALGLMAKPLMPSWLYLWLGNRQWKTQAKRRRVKGQLNARPCA